MSELTFYEQIDSRKITTGENASATLRYVLEGTSSDTLALTLAQSSTASAYLGLVRQSINVEPVVVDTATDTGRWNVIVRYGQRPAPAETGNSTYQFDTGGATVHITHALATVASYALPGKTPTDFKGAINVAGSGADQRIEGLDITQPVFNWSETHYLASASPAGYFALTGKVNSAPFRGFAAGEVLFLGASGTNKGSNWEITFRFSALPNKTNITLGGITVGAKKGWEHLWWREAADVDTASNRLTSKPIEGYVVKVYEEADFAGLGIGTT